MERKRRALPVDIITGLEEKATLLGYPQKGGWLKLVRTALDVMESMPALFRKR